MFETNIVIVGNVLTAPEWRRTTSNRTLVTNFRVASTARRLDRNTGRWVDGDHLRVRVNCWRRLAEGVAASITVGDPVVVTGRLYTRDWTDSEGAARTSYEMEAVAVGHDLSRGRAKFFRIRPGSTGTVDADGPESSGVVRGEAAVLVPDHEVPATYGDGIPDEEEPTFAERPPAAFDPVAALIGLTAQPGRLADAGTADDDLSPVDDLSPLRGGPRAESESAGSSDDDESPDDGESAGRDGSAEDGSPDDGGSLGDGGSPGQHGSPGDGESSEIEIEVEPVAGESAGRRRPRRTTRRQPIPA